MKFGCNCGNTICDTTDFLSYKADFLASQDEEDLLGGLRRQKGKRIMRKLWYIRKLQASRQV